MFHFFIYILIWLASIETGPDMSAIRQENFANSGARRWHDESNGHEKDLIAIANRVRGPGEWKRGREAFTAVGNDQSKFCSFCTFLLQLCSNCVCIVGSNNWYLTQNVNSLLWADNIFIYLLIFMNHNEILLFLVDIGRILWIISFIQKSYIFILGN